MSTTKLEKGIIDDGTSNQAMIQPFFRTLPDIHLKFPEAWVFTSRQDHHLLAKCDWWLVTEKKERLYFYLKVCGTM